MKNILCAFAEPEPGILEELFVYGREHGWQLELCGRRLPAGLDRGWRIDRLSEQRRAARNPEF